MGPPCGFCSHQPGMAGLFRRLPDRRNRLGAEPVFTVLPHSLFLCCFDLFACQAILFFLLRCQSGLDSGNGIRAKFCHFCLNLLRTQIFIPHSTSLAARLNIHCRLIQRHLHPAGHPLVIIHQITAVDTLLYGQFSLNFFTRCESASAVAGETP